MTRAVVGDTVIEIWTLISLSMLMYSHVPRATENLILQVESRSGELQYMRRNTIRRDTWICSFSYCIMNLLLYRIAG